MASSFMNNLDFPPLQAFPSSWSSYCTFSSNHKNVSFHESANNNNCQNNSELNNANQRKQLTNGNLPIQIPHHHQHQMHQYPLISPSATAMSTTATTIAPPKYPLYLRYTNYANLITEQYQHLQQKKKRNAYYDYYNKELEEVDLRLPTFWNKSKHSDLNVNCYDVTLTDPRHKQLHKSLSAFTNGLNSDSRSILNQQSRSLPVSIRTNFSIPAQCGIYYFEVKILSLGQDGVFAVGFCTSESKLDKLPGHDKFSIGYHGIDGQLYSKSIKQNQELPSFTIGDIIGCGINFAHETVFFTKNGVLLGTAFQLKSSEMISTSYYPCVGLTTLGEKITANFGQELFLFDIVNYVKTQEISLKRDTLADTLPVADSIQEKKDTNHLILSYLIHHGYIGAAKALMKNLGYIYKDTAIPISAALTSTDIIVPPTITTIEEDNDKEDFRKLIMSGHHIDTVMETVYLHYPHLLENNPELLFQLRSQKFLDMFLPDHGSDDNSLSVTPQSSASSASSSSSSTLVMTDYFSSTPTSTNEEDAGLNASFASFTFGTTPITYTEQGRNRTYSLDSIHEEDSTIHRQSQHQQQCLPIVSTIPVAASGRRLSWAAIAASPTKEDVSHSPNSSSMAFLGRRRRFSSFSMAFQGSLHSNEDHHQQDYQCYKAIQYGQQLQKEYQHQTFYIDQLMDMFTLFTCSDLKSNPWLSVSRRDQLASELSSAIQNYQYHKKMSDLELVYRQAIVTNNELVVEGNGKAALLQV
ncbi:hypothetical protein BDF20DRAFT_986304 [Mycotypha africana]|uniref:uncharacterized protein n=1 Tax=Mycotypha africana TaxID=64632 RepID=UPI00230095BC|nr:uncharacterized protein BDF20DRAFT_986304 [Mycotypha africana]KAI8984413.1 hypothetical protein BDF20DRAFT_986304 [Mycotypha africana]